MFVEIITNGHFCTINFQYAMEIYFNSFEGIILTTQQGPVNRKYHFEIVKKAKTTYNKILCRLQNGGVM